MYIIKIFDLQIFVVTETIIVSVWPIAIADDTDLAIHKVLSVSSVENQHW